MVAFLALPILALMSSEQLPVLVLMVPRYLLVLLFKNPRFFSLIIIPQVSAPSPLHNMPFFSDGWHLWLSGHHYPSEVIMAAPYLCIIYLNIQTCGSHSHWWNFVAMVLGVVEHHHQGYIGRLHYVSVALV